MKSNASDEQEIFTTGTRLSEPNAWFISLVRQFRAFQAERRNPTPKAEITAESDPSALSKLVSPPSMIVSLFRSAKASIQEIFHPHHTETTATRIAVEELWSKKENHIPGLLSLLVHVSVVSGLIYLSVVSYATPKVAKQNNDVLMEPIALSLPPAATKPGGGGGGGTRMKTPPSKGQLPKAATYQVVPPTTQIVNMAPELVAEPTVIVPQLVNLQHFNSLIPIGDPNGVVGPPSNGPGTGAGIGTGNGHGVGSGDGAGAGPGNGIGIGGGTYKVGGVGGASAPACPRVEPNYSDEARRAHIQGAVILDAIVEKDGTIQPNKVVNGLGYGLDDEAIKSVKTWKCTPGRYEGQPVAVSVRITINFRLY